MRVWGGGGGRIIWNWSLIRKLSFKIYTHRWRRTEWKSLSRWVPEEQRRQKKGDWGWLKREMKGGGLTNNICKYLISSPFLISNIRGSPTPPPLAPLLPLIQFACLFVTDPSATRLHEYVWEKKGSILAGGAGAPRGRSNEFTRITGSDCEGYVAKGLEEYVYFGKWRRLSGKSD